MATDITTRIDAVTKISETRIKMGGIQPPPKSVKIELTSRCNLKCKFCAVQTRETQSNKDMDFEFFKAITMDMRMSGVEEIGMFYLGEPFMNVELLENAIKWCKEIGFPYTFTTSNAILANENNVERVMAAGLDSLKWSVNSASPEQFESITGCNGSLFWKQLDNIKKAYHVRYAGKYKTQLSASSILYDGEQREKMKEVVDKYILGRVDKHYWLPLYQMSMYKDKIFKEIGYMPTAGNCGRIDEATMQPTRFPLPCWCTITEGHVRYDGGLSACGFGADSKFDMGILDGKNFMQTWNSKKFQDLRVAQFNTLVDGQEALRGTPCEVCVAY